MAQNPIYVAHGGKKSNRTVEEAHGAERKLALIGCPSLGIVAEGNGGQRVEEADFEENDIDTELPLNLLIRTSRGNGPDRDADGNEVENAIADQGEFQSVDKILDTIKAAPNAIEGIKRLINMTKPGVQGDAMEGLINGLPGVAAAREAAVIKAWEAA